MEWINVSRKIGTHTRLVTTGAEIQKITECMMTFYLSGTERPDERRHPFFTGVGPTPNVAEEMAYMVYLRAHNCSHQFEPRDTTTQVCRVCGVMRRAHTAASRSERFMWQRWFRGAPRSPSAPTGK
ncbi:hypothetical protein GCM10008949_40040 [Deinococcus humi]|nr:hypothetical protein GCM10008949_40040 [Deinococcus humi]